MNRIQEINLEIKTLLKTDPTSKKLESLQRELKELLIKKRLPPTIFKALNEKERKPRKQKQTKQIRKDSRKIASLIKESNLVDFQNARASKVAKEFQEEILSGKLYNELRKKVRSNK